MAQGVLVFIEARQGAIKKSSLEALAAGRRLADSFGQEVTALVIGADPGNPELATHGADKVLAARHDQLAAYSPEGYCAALVQAVQKTGAAVVLGSATAMGRDFLPRAAAALRAGLAQDCVEVAIVDGKLECVRPIYAGKAFARVRPTTTPAMATLRPNVFGLQAGAAPKAAAVEEFVPSIRAEKIRARVTNVVAAGGQKVELTEANIIVSGGRGLKGPENFQIVQGLADALGGALGASRAAVDAGWIDHSHQVGQTGKTVSPGLYIACGISGAIQHLAGMSSSKCIVAINKDPEAPIFKVASYGIVGDLFAVVPALTQEVRKLKSN